MGQPGGSATPARASGTTRAPLGADRCPASLAVGPAALSPSAGTTVDGMVAAGRRGCHRRARSARRIREALKRRHRVSVGVVISDTFGRTWRRGVTDVAIGCAGIQAVVDLRGTRDALGRELVATEICVVDEIAAAADLVMGKARGVPVALVRGVDEALLGRGAVAEEVVRPYGEDLFR